ncbi:hypothetical protein [Pseudomonas cremoricolorata]|uniref:hypothetical protein n=1 Tax=Pseudomonas cremoricolorata TaxID=157783 RepID=UPI00042883EF|nr:hypothetical protein [Pseudomonas cremoricolorata]
MPGQTPPPPAVKPAPGVKPPPSATSPTAADTAALIDNVVSTFRAGMSAQNRQDAQNSFQFAALAASVEFDRKQQREQWFDRMVEILRTCGWSVQQRSYEKETASSTSITVGDVALRVFGVVGRAVLGGPIGDALGALAAQAFDGLSVMTKDVEAFLAKKHDSLKGLTGIVGCVESEGVLTMVISAVDAKAPGNDLDVLGINVKLAGSEYYKGSAVLVLNAGLYGQVREHILGQLGEHTVKGVLNITLPKA